MRAIIDSEDLFAQCSVGSHISRLNRARTVQRGEGKEEGGEERANEVESGPKKNSFGKWRRPKTLSGSGIHLYTLGQLNVKWALQYCLEQSSCYK